MFDMFGCYALHEQQKMDIINYLAAAADPNDEGTQNYAFARIGANPLHNVNSSQASNSRSIPSLCSL